MANGSIIARLYDFLDGMKIHDYHLDNEFNQIMAWINGSLGDVNIASDANITGSKLKVGTIPLDRIAGSLYDAATVDAKMAAAGLGQVPDNSVANVKLLDRTITNAKIAMGTITAGEVSFAVIKVLRVGHTYTIPGEVKVAVGDVDFIPPFFLSFANGQTAKAVKVRYKINSGTSVTFKLQRNGVDLTGFTGQVAGVAAVEVDPADVSLADGDVLSLVVTAVVGTPKNFSCTIFIDYMMA